MLLIRLNYKTKLLGKVKRMEEKIDIFNFTIMHGKIGVVRSIRIPSLAGRHTTDFDMQKQG